MAGNNSFVDNLIVSAAIEAGTIGMSYFGKDTTNVWFKQGNSPVSQADQEIDKYLHKHLLDNRPDHGWLSEETEDNAKRLDMDNLFIVDPIDGTRGFIAGRKEWCISISIVKNNRPIEGVLHCPALDKTIYAASGAGVYVNGNVLQIRQSHRKTPLVTGSKNLINAVNELPEQPMNTSEFIPSLAYRLSLVATGDLDAAFARPGASEWDVAAADIILAEAGCQLSDKNGNPFHYNQKKVTLPSLVAAPVMQQSEILALAKSTRILH